MSLALGRVQPTRGEVLGRCGRRGCCSDEPAQVRRTSASFCGRCRGRWRSHVVIGTEEERLRAIGGKALAHSVGKSQTKWGQSLIAACRACGGDAAGHATPSEPTAPTGSGSAPPASGAEDCQGRVDERRKHRRPCRCHKPPECACGARWQKGASLAARRRPSSGIAAHHLYEEVWLQRESSTSSSVSGSRVDAAPAEREGPPPSRCS